jgi:hypothetical protein
VFLGEWQIDDLLTFSVNTHTPSTGAETDADAVPAYRVYEDETGTAILTGTMSLLDDTNTVGHYSEQITLSAANGFEVGKSYTIRIRAVVGGIAGSTIHSFQVEAALATAAALATVQADTDNLQTRLPAALVSGRMDSSVGAMAADVITASAIADNAIDAGAIATDAITAAKIAADAIGSSELAASAVTEIQSGLSTLDAAGIRSAVGLASANLDTQLSDLPTAGENASAVWDRDATGHQTQGTFGQAIGDPGADTDTLFGLVNTNLNATVSSRASQTSVDTIDDFLDTEVAAIKTQTDKFTFTQSGQVDASIVDADSFAQAAADKVWSSAARTLTSLGASLVQEIWDRATSALATAGSIGKLIVDNLNATITSRSSQASVDTVDDFLDTEVAAIKAKTDLIPASPAAVGSAMTLAADSVNASALNPDAITELLNALGARIVEGAITYDQVMRLMLAAEGAKTSGGGTTTFTIRDASDTKDRVVATVDSDGNRTAVTRDLT